MEEKSKTTSFSLESMLFGFALWVIVTYIFVQNSVNPIVNNNSNTKNQIVNQQEEKKQSNTQTNSSNKENKQDFSTKGDNQKNLTPVDIQVNAVYIDPNCSLDICKQDYIKNNVIWMMINDTWIDIKYIDLTSEDWEKVKSKIDGTPFMVVDKTIKDKIVQKNSQAEQYFKQLDENKWYLVFYMWKPFEENICDDWKDNNGDWKIDLDDPTCKTLTVLYDSRCSKEDSQLCDIGNLVNWLKSSSFPVWYVIDKIDWTTDEWKQIYSKLPKWTKLPVIITKAIDPKLEEQLKKFSYLKNIDVNWYKYMITFLPSEWDPTGEICNNQKDDNGDWKVDCEDESCSWKLVCRKEIKWKLDLFIMWYCPFGEIAAKQLPALKKALNNNIDISIHYIADKVNEKNTAEWFNSLHGVKEAEEDIRQMCVQKYYWTEKLIDYLQERYKNADNYWQVKDDPAGAIKFIWWDPDKIKECVENWEWAKLLEEDVKLAKKLQINASPTWLANNRYKFGGIDANVIKDNFCKHNSQIAECNNGEKIETDNKNNWQNPTCGN